MSKIDDIIYLTIDQAKFTHELTIKYSGGGMMEVLDLGRLEGVLEQIKNDEWYPTLSDKLTHLFFCACNDHCFADGNKRVAITLSSHFLLKNGYQDLAKDFLVDMENISANVASGKISKNLLHKIISALLNGTYIFNEELKLEIYNAIKD